MNQLCSSLYFDKSRPLLEEILFVASSMILREEDLCWNVLEKTAPDPPKSGPNLRSHQPWWNFAAQESSVSDKRSSPRPAPPIISCFVLPSKGLKVIFPRPFPVHTSLAFPFKCWNLLPSLLRVFLHSYSLLFMNLGECSVPQNWCFYFFYVLLAFCTKMWEQCMWKLTSFRIRLLRIYVIFRCFISFPLVH